MTYIGLIILLFEHLKSKKTLLNLILLLKTHSPVGIFLKTQFTILNFAEDIWKVNWELGKL